MSKDSKLIKSCPSSTCDTGAVLLGKVKKDGTVGFLSSRLELDESSVTEFAKLGTPEVYYRFSNTCVESGCKQWDQSAGHCSVIKKILTVEVDFPLSNTLPNCLIRKTCRWYFQDGAAACRICPLVVTDMTDAG